jgi:orotate phosphoribosyltransferase-like protein
VDDIVRTGHATEDVFKMIKSMGGNVIAAASVVRFASAPAEIDGVPLQSLVEFNTIWYKGKDQCPLCKEGSEPETVRF